MSGFLVRERTYVIAEIGSNHGGSLDAALTLIDAAAGAGADAAKFQAGHADHVYDPAQFPKEYASFKKYLEPVLDWLPELWQRCSDWGIDFGCSTFCFDSLDAVDPYVKWHKVASIEATWDAYVAAVKAKGKPVIISTGGIHGGDANALMAPNVITMQCTLAYPANLEDCDLLAGPRMHGGPLFGHVPSTWMVTNKTIWGLSDHTIHPTIAPCAAAALGARVIEKHLRPEFMPDGDLPPDWDHSIEPWQFRHMVEAIRLTEKALGSPQKWIRESERPYLRYRRGPRGLRGG